MQKLYVYVDESGQDTGGRYFIVEVVISDISAIQGLGRKLEQVERATKKRKRKWTHARLLEKVGYLERLFGFPELVESIFFESFRARKDYTELTTMTTADAIQEKATPHIRRISQ